MQKAGLLPPFLGINMENKKEMCLHPHTGRPSFVFGNKTILECKQCLLFDDLHPFDKERIMLKSKIILDK